MTTVATYNDIKADFDFFMNRIPLTLAQVCASTVEAIDQAILGNEAIYTEALNQHRQEGTAIIVEHDLMDLQVPAGEALVGLCTTPNSPMFFTGHAIDKPFKEMITLNLDGRNKRDTVDQEALFNEIQADKDIYFFIIYESMDGDNYGLVGHRLGKYTQDKRHFIPSVYAMQKAEEIHPKMDEIYTKNNELLM